MKEGQFEFRIQGRLGDKTIAIFDGFAAEVEPAATVLRGPVSDQSALHGILEQIEALGLTLIEVRQIPENRKRSNGVNLTLTPAGLLRS